MLRLRNFCTLLCNLFSFSAQFLFRFCLVNIATLFLLYCLFAIYVALLLDLFFDFALFLGG